MRARRAPDTTEFPSNPIAINIQSRSQSPVQIESPEAIDRAPSHYLRSFEALTSKYGENTNHNLKPAQVIEVIKAGDSFLRDHCVDFINSYMEAGGL
jgi:hypothetical protein